MDYNALLSRNKTGRWSQENPGFDVRQRSQSKLRDLIEGVLAVTKAEAGEKTQVSEVELRDVLDEAVMSASETANMIAAPMPSPSVTIAMSAYSPRPARTSASAANVAMSTMTKRACASEVACEPALVPALLEAHAPRLCAGGDAGALCTSDADCVSGTCNGGDELLVCEVDGRDCTESSDCPTAEGAFEPQCLAIGIVAGTCQ